MIGKIILGTLEVVSEILGGLYEALVDLWGNSDKIFAELNTKLMGSYEELEALELKKKNA